LTQLISPRSGRTIPHNVHPSESSPGWRVVASSLCDMTDAPDGSRCLEVVAPAADIESTNIAFAMYENSIPTDLYYSSLRGPQYDTPDRHDWDLNDDEFYGTNLWDRSADGVSYWPTVRLGRAPAGNVSEARNFVQKVIGYERYIRADGFAGRHLLTADNWGGPPTARRGSEYPPPEGRSYHDSARGFAIAHFGSAPSPASDWQIVAWNRSDLWAEFSYSRDAGPGIDGWYFCSDATCTLRSEFLWPSGLFGPLVWIPLPTRFVKVESTLSAFEDSAFYFFNHRDPDGAVQEKEQVKGIFERFFTGLDERQRLYKDFYDLAPAPDLSELFTARVTEALFRGVNVSSLSGHGWYGGCCGLDYAEVPQMDLPGTAAGMVYVDSCYTNEFDQAAGDAVSELMVNQEYGGAAAYVGNTRYGVIGLGSSFERSFWLRMRTTRHAGALLDAKAAYASHGPNEQWTNFALNLMGDPEMEVWRAEPSAMRLTGVSREVFEGARIHGRIVDSATGDGVPLARVTLTGPGVHQTKIADASGNFQFEPAGRPDDVLNVTATHIILEYKPVNQNVRVVRRVWTLVPPPTLPPSWPE
jgi:hypothetical protein